MCKISLTLPHVNSYMRMFDIFVKNYVVHLDLGSHYHNIPDKKRNAPLRTVELSTLLVYISVKVCQVLLRYTFFAIRHRNCVKENWS